jgi:hypothetical protein
MNEDSSEHGKQFFIPIFLTIITIVLGLISFQAVFPDYPFFRKLYYTFQLFTMESGDRFYENGGQTLTVTIVFNLARFFAIATLVVTIVLAILSVLRYKYFLSRVRFMKDHTILCGSGDVGEAIAENFPDKKKLVIIEKDTSDENLTRLKKEGVKIIEANALDVTILDKIGIEYAKSLVGLTGDDFDNLTIINNVLELLKDKGPDENNVFLSANIDSRNLKTAIADEWKRERDKPDYELIRNLAFLCDTACSIRSQGGFNKASAEFTGRFELIKEELLKYNPAGEDFKSCKGNIKLFNINQLAARFIFRIYPPDRFRCITKTDDPAMNILIMGYSKIGEEFFKLCVQNCHYINRNKTKITLISLDADAVAKRVSSIYKNVNNIIDFQAVNENPHHLTGKYLIKLGIANVDVIYICSGEDRYQASYSSRARELYGANVPVVRPFYRNETWNKTNPLKDLYSFNILSKVAILDDIVNECLDRKAIAVHHHWLKKAIHDYIDKVEKSITNDTDIPGPKPTMVPWHLLDEEIRDDNRSVVEHINVKLRSVGQLPDPAMYTTPELASINYGFISNPGQVEQLAEMEHRRWMATKYLYGWDYGIKRDTFLREHESLLDFSLLDEATKDYDRQQIKEMQQIIELK